MTKQRTRRRGALADVDLDMLKDTQRLFAWIPRAARQRGSKLSTSEWDRYRVLMAAEHALRVGREPVRLFVWLVKSGRWDYLADIDDDRARQRLRSWYPKPDLRIHGIEYPFRTVAR